LAAARRREAELVQAEYFRRIIGSLRLEAETRIARNYLDLQKLMSTNRPARITDLRRLIRVEEAELITLDRLGEGAGRTPR
jgi:hypothetical protein